MPHLVHADFGDLRPPPKIVGMLRVPLRRDLDAIVDQEWEDLLAPLRERHANLCDLVTRELGFHLAEDEDIEFWFPPDEADETAAAHLLVTLLRFHGVRNIDGLRAWVGADERDAADSLIKALDRRGLGEEAKQLRRFGLNLDGSIASA
jgi:hypothetical protein